jgi:tetratricopeptide (TPR) repeat protein
MLLFEDLHWIDAETQALLDSLVESLPAARLLLLANYRPEYQHRWGSKTYYRQLRIDPLPAESAEALLTSLLGTEQSLDSLKRTLIERTEGNPLFLEESVRTLVETKALIGERGAYQLAHDATAIQVPATVQAILAARIDRLSPEDKRLLQAASVIGKDVPFILLQASTEEPEDRLREGLGRLQAAEFLYEAQLFPDLEYTFKHALTQQVAYGGLLRERRQALHAGIVEAIERLHPDRIGENAEQLAHHAVRGELWSEAVKYLREAATRALARAASEEVVTHTEQALAALRNLEDTPETLRHAVDLRLSMESALMLLGRFPQGLEKLREAQILAERLGDRGRQARLLARITYNLGSLGDLEGAVHAGEVALTAARDAGELRAEGATYTLLARAHYALGNYREAVKLSRQNERVALETAKRGEPTNLAFTRVWLVLSLAELGEFEEALSWVLKTVGLAEREHGPHERVWAYFGAGRVHLVHGTYSDAIVVLERGLPLFDTGSLAVYVSRTFSTLGAAHALAGHVVEALPLLERAAREGEAIGFRYGHSLVLAHLAEGCRLAGRIDEAGSIAERALALAREQGERGHEAWILRLLGEVAAHRGSYAREGAHALYREALGRATDLGMRPLVAHCHLGLGKLYRSTGRPSEADEHVTIATTMYREMDMRFWLEQAEAETGRLP